MYIYMYIAVFAQGSLQNIADYYFDVEIKDLEITYIKNHQKKENELANYCGYVDFNVETKSDEMNKKTCGAASRGVDC